MRPATALAAALAVFLTGHAWRTHAQSTAPADAEAAIEACVSITNEYRRTVGRPPLTRDADLETFARDAAAYDLRVGKAHAYFRKTRGGGLSRAENQIPAWSLARYGTVLEVVRQGLALMWDEGPRGAHRKALADRRYTRLGCAVVVDGDRVTMVQEFR